MHTSHALEAEDDLLWELCGDKPDGFFIDVGACEPEAGSVSKSFYDTGWVGINIEPVPYLIYKFYAAQPRSRNLACALSDVHSEPVTLWTHPESTLWSTLDETIAKAKGMVPSGLVPVSTLAAVCERWHVGEIDWLKLDVEGWEGKVLAGNDWSRWRPRALCIESFTPHTTEPSHDQWEPFVLSQGYEFASGYGLNRFYRRTE